MRPIPPPGQRRGITLSPDQVARINAGLAIFFAANPLARDLLEPLCRDVIDAHASTQTAWEYLQMEPRVVAAVDQWIDDSAKRKRDTRRIWRLIIQHVDRRDGRIRLSRQEIADATGILPRHVSTCMADLASTDTIKRIETGRTVVYMLNPHVGTKLGRVAGHQARKGHARPTLVALNGEAVPGAEGVTHDPRQVDLEDAIAEEMRRTGRLPWDLPQ